MNVEAIRLSLYALRTQVDALIAQVDGAPAQTQGGCPHPEEKQVDATTCGGPTRVLCLVCNEEREA